MMKDIKKGNLLTFTTLFSFYKENMAAAILESKTKVSNLESKDSNFEKKIGKLMEVDNDLNKKSVSSSTILKLLRQIHL